MITSIVNGLLFGAQKKEGKNSGTEYATGVVVDRVQNQANEWEDRRIFVTVFGRSAENFSKLSNGTPITVTGNQTVRLSKNEEGETVPSINITVDNWYKPAQPRPQKTTEEADAGEVDEAPTRTTSKSPFAAKSL